MLQEILNLYYISVVSAVCLMMLDNMMSRNSDMDPFELMDSMNEMLNSMEDEKLKHLISSFLERSIENKALGYAFLFLLCGLPILNIFIIVMLMKSIVQNHKEGR
ncbi:hypothetical protein [Cellulosilyticum ruminicola]|uniref:hypothetical protein n=1 Tax=Cellulosilyticum ruminicola TaxID=425254 RepID=UPI0006CF2628|nr:hypothetical protein [Cellulosilyticum ruminicola]